jgi:parallel beta-helix repeat protein
MHALRPIRLLAVLAVLACPAPATRAAAAGQADHTSVCIAIATLPTTISVPGHYCLDKDFRQYFARNAVEVLVDDVLIDCNGHAIGPVDNSAYYPATGIVSYNHARVTVRNCTLENFHVGIAFHETEYGKSLGNRATGNLVRRSRLAGILVSGSGNVVDGNRITENLGNLNSAGPVTYGIWLMGGSGYRATGNVVRGNHVAGIVPFAYVDVVGIQLSDVTGTALSGNHVAALFPPRGHTASGIVADAGVRGTSASGNTVLAATSTTPPPAPLPYDGTSPYGIRFLAFPTQDAHNVCHDNIVGHFASNILAESPTGGCIKAQNSEF